MPTWSDLTSDSRGEPRRCVIIGEVAQAHDGSLGTAHAFIDAVADAGADAVKFQTHIASAESTPGEPWRVTFSRQDDSRFDYWRRMEFSEAQWVGLKQHADERHLLFLSSPFSMEAVDLLERVGVAAWKVASGETANTLLLSRIARAGVPVLVSTGISHLAELDRAVSLLESYGCTPTLLQCTTAYPCPPEKVGLNVIAKLRERYHCPVGLSDHSGTIYPGLAAATLGINALEVHVTLSRQMFGPDVVASITTAELSQLVEGIRFIEAMNDHPIDKDRAADEMAPMRALFTKSVAVRQTLSQGTVLTADHLTVKKPGTGIPAARLPELYGRRLRRDVTVDELLTESDLEHA